MDSSALQRIKKQTEVWFIKNTFYFLIFSTHSLIENDDISSIRVYNGKVEYNPDFIDALSDKQLSEVLEFEVIRIVLKHPYSREKENRKISYFASNITLKEYLKNSLPFPKAKEVSKSFKRKMYFEYYYNLMIKKGKSKKVESVLQEIKNEEKKELKDEKNSDYENEESVQRLFEYLNNWEENTFSWEKDDYWEYIINDKIEYIYQNKLWGNLPADFEVMILASLKPKINYRAILKMFKASVVSSSKVLTRMKPSRRYGFAYMGKKYEFTSKLLIAVDVSLSMRYDDLMKGFSLINALFKYGIKSIDVIQFDVRISVEKQEFKKAVKNIKIKGRGGTDFQVVFDYVYKNRGYDGLIIFTDGYAPLPEIKRKIKTLWILTDEEAYLENAGLLSKTGVVMYLGD